MTGLLDDAPLRRERVERKSWALRYAPHLGYMGPDRPQFETLVGDDPVDHVAFAADQGWAGIMDPWVLGRPLAQRQQIKAALGRTGLNYGCIVPMSWPRFLEPWWVIEGQRQELLDSITEGLDLASDLGSQVIAVVMFADGDTAPQIQRRRAADRLRAAADLAAERGAIIGVEPIMGPPGLLLNSFAEAVELVRNAGHPAVKLIFDTGHVAALGSPVLASYVEAYDDIGVLQLADMPGRVEVGAGEMDIVSIMAHALRRDYRGLVELEHNWADESAEGQLRGIEMLHDADMRAARQVSRP